MSFLDNLKNVAGQLLAGANQQDTANAAGEHVAQMDPQELAGHLKDSLSSMDSEKAAALGRQLLQTFTSSNAYQGDGAQAAQEAGTTQEAVASGVPGAVGALIAYSQQHPEILQAAGQAFMQRNPAALEQLAPGLISGILARLGVNPSQAQPQPQTQDEP